VAEALHLLERGEAAPDAALLDVNLRGELVTPVAEALRARGVPSSWPAPTTAWTSWRRPWPGCRT
jgi:hypothetical protein